MRHLGTTGLILLAGCGGSPEMREDAAVEDAAVEDGSNVDGSREDASDEDATRPDTSVPDAAEDAGVDAESARGAYAWDLQLGDDGLEAASGIATTADGFVVAGTFFESMAFAGGPTLEATASDGFVAAFDDDGGFSWATQLSSESNVAPGDVVADADGNVYVTGEFIGTLVVGSGYVFSEGNFDLFVVSLDPEGRYRWAFSIGGPGRDTGTDLAIDPETGDVVVVGSSSGNLVIDGVTEPRDAMTDAIVVCLSAEGERRWHHLLGGASHDFGLSVARAGTGWVVGGRATGAIDLGGGEHAIDGPSDAFLVAFDAEGERTWDRTFGGEGADSVFALATSGGQIVAAGSISEGADLGLGARVVDGDSDGFVAGLDEHGVATWERYVGGTARPGLSGADSVSSIAVDEVGNVVAAGSFWGSATIGDDALEAVDFADVFMASFASTGEPRWAIAYGGEDSDYVVDIALGDDAVFGVGSFRYAIDFGGGVRTPSNEGFPDAYVVRRDD